MTPLVLVHGYLGGRAQWGPQAADPQLAPRLHPVALPGFGDASEAIAPDSIAGFARAVLAQLSADGIERFDLLGHSMGGMIAQQMVAEAQARVERLVLYGTGPLGEMPGRFETLARSRERALDDGVAATADRISATWFLHGESDPAWAECAAIARQASEQAMLAGLDAMQAWRGDHHLSAIAANTLVLWGDGDRAYRWPVVESLWQGIPGAALAVIPGCSHAVHLEKPALFNAQLRDFLAIG